MYWSKTNVIKIDTAVLFVNLEIEEMVNKKFNPGGPVAMYERSENGISPLIVIPITTQDIEENIRREEVEAGSQGTRTQAEALQMEKADPRCPSINWYKLK